MRILVLTPYLYGTTPGTRSSIELWEGVLADAGIHFDYAPFESERLHEILYLRGHILGKAREMLSAWLRRIPVVRQVQDYDAVLVYREAALVGPEILERLVARKGVPIIYQLDDPLYIPYRSPSNGYLSYLKFFGKVGRIARMASMTIVNSRHHFEYVSRYTSRIRMIPILVDADRYTYLGHSDAPTDVVHVGWSGSPTTAPNLELIHPTLKRLSERSDVELRLIGGGSYDLPGVRFTARPWSSDTEVAELRQLDVGLLPVPESDWNKRKFFMKLIQYMSLGIPPVCTPLGANSEVVIHGENGLLAASPAEWDEALDALISRPELRAEMGERAARTAHASYTIQARADDVVEAFHAALA